MGRVLLARGSLARLVGVGPFNVGHQRMHEFLRAPWANQAVSPFVRILAWVFVACGVFAFSAGIYFSFMDGVPTNLPIEGYALLVGTLYLMAIFLFVGIRGRAPSGWLPWR